MSLTFIMSEIIVLFTFEELKFSFSKPCNKTVRSRNICDRGHPWNRCNLLNYSSFGTWGHSHHNAVSGSNTVDSLGNRRLSWDLVHRLSNYLISDHVRSLWVSNHISNLLWCNIHSLHLVVNHLNILRIASCNCSNSISALNDTSHSILVLNTEVNSTTCDSSICRHLLSNVLIRKSHSNSLS